MQSNFRRDDAANSATSWIKMHEFGSPFPLSGLRVSDHSGHTSHHSYAPGFTTVTCLFPLCGGKLHLNWNMLACSKLQMQTRYDNQ